MLIQQLINGLTLGSLYALIALGYTMVYGVLLMINFAHSEILMVGAFAGCFLLKWPWLAGAGLKGLLIAVLGAMVAAGLTAFLIERLAYRPLRRASRLTPLISAIGVSIFLQNAAFLLISTESIAVPDTLGWTPWHVGGLDLYPLQVLIIGSSLALLVVLHLFVNRTRLGTAIRAISQDASTASLMGIPINRMIALTFVIGGALGGVAGALNGLYYGSIKYNMGFVPGMKAFTAAVLGGIGNVGGAMAGGFLLGITESLAAGLLPNGSDWKDVIAFSILILVLLFRPSGLFGRHIQEKV